MSDEFKRVIFDLLQFQRTAPESTKEFNDLKHNQHLCPRLQEKLEFVLSAFEKYRKITYDIQGVRDRGSDVVLKQSDENINRFICFQIKTKEDLIKPDYLKTLKAQYFDSLSAYKELIDYYILLCFHSKDEKFKEKMRTIEADFAPSIDAHVIEPEFVYTFLHLNSVRIDANIKSKFGSEDIVYRNAMSIVNNLTPTEMSILYFLLWSKVYGKEESTNLVSFQDSNFINNVFGKTPDYKRNWFFEDENDDKYFKQEEQERGLDISSRIYLDLQFLDENYISSDSADKFFLDIDSLQPLLILMMDGNERYGYENDELLYYMMDLFVPLKGYS